MKELLKNLNEGVGIRGCLVMTRDGVVVASSLDDDLEEETVAALASSILIALMKPEKGFELGDAARFTLSAKHGRLIFEIMESLVLVVVTLEEFTQLFLKFRGFSIVDLIFDYAGIIAFGKLAEVVVRRRRQSTSIDSLNDG